MPPVLNRRDLFRGAALTGGGLGPRLITTT